jgi:succinylarginine dihydrolase
LWIAEAALAIAAAGTISSTVYLALALLGAWKFHRGARAQEREAAAISSLPPVSIL